MRVQPQVQAWLTVGLVATVYMTVIMAATWVVAVLAHGSGASGVRAEAAIRISGSALGQLCGILLLAAFLHARGRTLQELGLWKSASLVPWFVAVVLAAGLAAMMLSGPLRGAANLKEATLFRVYTSVVAALGAGFGEEIVFRGYVMSEIGWSGGGHVSQVVAAAVIFGLAHARWASLGQGFDPHVLLGSSGATTVAGALYAALYLISGRSLMPAIASHALTDFVIEPWLILAALGGALGR
jgi:membrane protease YdiL (CAAX protease family)